MTGNFKRPPHQKIHTTIMQIPTPEIVYPGTKCKGEPSYVNKLKPISLQEVHSPVRKNFKN